MAELQIDIKENRSLLPVSRVKDLEPIPKQVKQNKVQTKGNKNVVAELHRCKNETNVATKKLEEEEEEVVNH